MPLIGVWSRTGAPLSPLGGIAAADALIAGQVDAVLIVAGVDAPVIQRLLQSPGVRLMSLTHAETLARRFNYLSAITLPRGMIDLAADIPATLEKRILSLPEDEAQIRELLPEKESSKVIA